MKTLITALLILLPASAIASSTLRCNSALISTDDSSGVIISKCGEPLSRAFLGYREVIDAYGFRQEVAVEVWPAQRHVPLPAFRSQPPGGNRKQTR